MDDATTAAGLSLARPGARALLEGDAAWCWSALAETGLPPDRPLVLEARREVETVARLVAALVQGVPVVTLHPRWTEAERAALLARLEGATLPEGTAWVVPTSGSTGPARGVVLSSRAVRASALAVAEHLSLGPEDVWGVALPLAHVGGLSILSRALLTGASLVLAPEGPFDPVGWQRRLSDTGVTHLSLVPTQLAALLEAGMTGKGALRCVLVGGAACPPALVTAARAAGLPVALTWGMSELASQVATGPATVAATPPGEVGPPLPGVSVTVDAEGVLSVQGPMAFDGYLGEPGTGPDAEGRVRTGDLGELTSDGAVRILGRRDAVIVTGGENVHPEAVEAALLAHPALEAVCVVGVPDPRWGEQVVALVVGHALPEDAALDAFARASLAPFRCPRRWLRVDALPLTPSGKVDRSRARTLVPSVA